MRRTHVWLMVLVFGLVKIDAQTCDKTAGSDRAPCAGSSAHEQVKSPAFKMGDVQRTFIMVKPDGVQRGLVGAIIKRFETKGYRLVALKMMQASGARLADHYAEHEGKGFYEGLLQYLMSGPVVPMVWEGKAVIATGRAMIGATNPLVSAPGTIRGDYGITVGRNIIHGSDGEESAEREINIWFGDEELVQWEPCCTPWIYE